MPEEPLPLDGRLARSERTRRAIIEALRGLHGDGDLRPTAPRVAERAGVSLRTVWQHFDDLESLFVEGGRRDLEIARGFLHEVDPALPLASRVGELVAQRSRMYEAMAPTWRAARLQEPFSPQIQSNRDRLMALGREQLRTVFATELAGAGGANLLDRLQVVTSWAAWECLRVDMKLGVAAARAVVTALLTSALTG